MGVATGGCHRDEHRNREESLDSHGLSSGYPCRRARRGKDLSDDMFDGLRTGGGPRGVILALRATIEY
jgi:hypothetical protein